MRVTKIKDMSNNFEKCITDIKFNELPQRGSGSLSET